MPAVQTALPQPPQERAEMLAVRASVGPSEGPVCPHCGTTLRPGARFCRSCGAALPQYEQPAAGSATERDHFPCPQCGAPARVGARFCPACSHPLPIAPSTRRGHPPMVSRRNGAFGTRMGQPGRFGTGSLLPLSTLAERYLILEKIAQGGMGAVYKAQDQRLQGKIVAVKEMSESAIAATEVERILGSFQREAELLARLEHANLGRVSDCFKEEERHYMVMEFVAGQTLERMLNGRSETFPEERVLIWADQLCDVLSYLHSREPKIIYRDMKPANVMVIDGSDTVKLIDFGIARFFKPGKRRDTMEFGTYGYAPPEQYGKSQTDERSDIYALGATLHHLLTLRPPATKPFQFPTVRSLNPSVSQRVEAAIMKALEPDKAGRHQSVAEMREALRAPLSGRIRPASESVSNARPAVDFSKVVVGSLAAERCVMVNLPGSGQAKLDTDTQWVRVRPRSIDQSGSQVVISLDTTHLKPGRLRLQGGWIKRWIGWHARFLIPAEQEDHARVQIVSNNGRQQDIPVRVTIVPRPWRVLVGWIATIGVILLELVAVVGGLGILATMVVSGRIP